MHIPLLNYLSNGGRFLSDNLNGTESYNTTSLNPTMLQGMDQSQIFFLIFFSFTFLILLIVLCRPRRRVVVRTRVVEKKRKHKKKVLYCFRDPNNPNQLIYAKYSRRTGRYKVVRYELQINKYEEVSTVQMNVAYNPNLNYAPPSLHQENNNIQPNYNQQYFAPTYGQQGPYQQPPQYY